MTSYEREQLLLDKDDVVNRDTFDMFREIQEKLITILGRINFGNGEPTGEPYDTERVIREDVPLNKQTRLSIVKEKIGKLYKMKYQYTLEDKA